MACTDDWTEAAASAETTHGCRILWQCLTADTKGRRTWADYPPKENLCIEVAHSAKTPTVKLGESPRSWTIDLEKMVQTNDTSGTIRCIRRCVEVAF